MAFGVHVEVDPSRAGLTVYQVMDRLKEGDPPIWTRVRDDEDWIDVHVFGLADGEAEIVGERMAALFR
jgi:hypothetical protein